MWLSKSGNNLLTLQKKKKKIHFFLHGSISKLNDTERHFNAVVIVCFIILQSDYHFEYTDCDVLGSRWRVAIPNKPETCTGLPDPVKGTQCSEYLQHTH